MAMLQVRSRAGDPHTTSRNAIRSQVKFRAAAVLAAVGCALASTPAQAGYLYELRGITPGEVIPVNTTRTVEVYLNYDGQGAPNVLPGGLFSAWTGLRYTSGTTASLSVVNPPQPDGAPPSGGTGIRANADFNNSATRGPGNAAFSDAPGYTRLYALLAASNLPPNYATSTSANNQGGTPTSLFIGSFDLLTANTAAVSEPITLQANLYDFSSGANIVTSTFAALDPVTQPGSVSFAIAAVPEPGMTALVGFALAGFGAALGRKRRG